MEGSLDHGEYEVVCAWTSQCDQPLQVRRQHQPAADAIRRGILGLLERGRRFGYGELSLDPRRNHSMGAFLERPGFRVTRLGLKLHLVSILT